MSWTCTRCLSRYRLACSEDFTTRLRFGATLVEPISFAMDRRMLLGVKARCERAWHTASLRTMPAPRPLG